MTNPGKRIAALAAASAALGAAAPAQAATTQIGAVADINAGVGPAPFTTGGHLFQIAATGKTYAVPAGYGVITAWRHMTSTTSGPLSLKVFRPSGGLQFTTVGSDARTVTAGTNHTFPVQIRVQGGDIIGLSSEDVAVAYQTGDEEGDLIADTPEDPPVGSTFTPGPGPEGYYVAIAAVVETDNDADGQGDDTQDADDDNDGVADTADTFPLNGGESSDADADGQGDNADADDDNDRLPDAVEAAGKTNPLDLDSDDDGLADGREDKNGDGRKGKKETSARKRDSDGDRLTDGVERGVKKPVADPPGVVAGTAKRRFRKDADPKTRSNPLRADSDRDGLKDGKEDKDRDGKRDKRETSPKSGDSDKDGTRDKKDDFPLNRRRD